MKNHLAADRMVAVDRVATARVIFVGAVRVVHVIDLVLQAFEAQRRAFLIPLGGVIEYDVQDHLNTRGVQRADHFFELSHLVAGLVAVHVAAMGREKCERVVAPVVFSRRLVAERVKNREFVNRHQLDGRHAERLKIRDLVDHAQIGSRMFRFARRTARKSTDVHLVDDGLGEWMT